MTNRLLLFLALFATSSILFAQTVFHFDGFIKLNLPSFPYKVVFEEQGNKIFGYSITDFGGENETKSFITGSIDRITNTIKFEEVELDYAKNLDFKDRFCFIRFKGSLVDVEGEKHLKGQFNSMFEIGKQYVYGEVNVILTNDLPPEIIAKGLSGENKSVIDSEFSKLAVSDTINTRSRVIAINMISQPEEELQGVITIDNLILRSTTSFIPLVATRTAIPKEEMEDPSANIETVVKTSKTKINETSIITAPLAINSRSVNEMRKDDSVTVATPETTITILIYDQDQVDDDAIDLYIDNLPVLVNHRATFSKKRIQFKLKNQSTVVVITAKNNGIIGKNSVRFDIIEGENMIRTLSNMSAGDSATIVFEKQ